VSVSGKTSTPNRILDVAEAMFAEQGYKAVSLRSVLRECGANIAAAHYGLSSTTQFVDSPAVASCLCGRGAPVRGDVAPHLLGLCVVGGVGLLVGFFRLTLVLFRLASHAG